MNLNSVQNGYCKSNLQKYNNKHHHFANSFDVHFQGNTLRVVTDNNITYRQANKLISTIDGVLGSDKFFANNIQKAKAAGLKVENNNIIFKKPTLARDIISTAKYPFTDMWFDLLSAACKSLKKTPLSSTADKILKVSFIKKNMDRLQAQKSYELVNNILEQFVSKDDKSADKLGNKISLKTTAKITQTAKNYKSRDERTLNRLVTGFVGASLSAVDIHNISMLEKNDKKSAKKAEKERFEQEMTRIGISCGLTFLSLGALNKYAKGSDLKSAIIVAACALAAEILSRVRTHKPLYPISPERAAQIAKERNSSKNSSSESVNTVMTRISKNDKNNLYKDFTQKTDITAAPQQEENKPGENTKEPAKKDNKILKWIGLVFLISNVGFLASRWMKGVYAQKAARAKIFNDFGKELQHFIKSDSENIELSAKLVKAIEEAKKLRPEIVEKTAKTLSKNEPSINFFGKTMKLSEILAIPKGKILEFKDKMLSEKITVDLKNLEAEINQLNKTKGGKDLEPVLNLYREQIKLINAGDKFSLRVSKPVPNAICAGVTKLFKTIYTGLSLPANLIDKAINKKYFSKSEEVFKKVGEKRYFQNPEMRVDDYKKQLAQLDNLFNKNIGKKNKYEKVANNIKMHTRNFEPNSETGDLANLSRTLVTLISSWFYVNDFRNTVLIESEGKNVERAREVRNDSIGFKLANFFFNGTLMNLANSLLKEPLNRSLIGATIIPFGTEVMNEFLIRKTIARPMKRLDSREEIIEYDQKRMNRKGPAGWWTRAFKKVTGQKSLVEKYEAQQARKK